MTKDDKYLVEFTFVAGKQWQAKHFLKCSLSISSQSHKLLYFISPDVALIDSSVTDILYTAPPNFWMVSCSQVSYCSVNAKYLDSECNGPSSSWSLLQRYCPFLLLPTKLTLQRGSTFCCVLPLSVLWQLEQTCWANSLDKYKEIHLQTFPAERWKLVKYVFGSAPLSIDGSAESFPMPNPSAVYFFTAAVTQVLSEKPDIFSTLVSLPVVGNPNQLFVWVCLTLFYLTWHW